MLVLSIERPATGFVFSFKNGPAVTDLLMCSKYWRQRNEQNQYGSTFIKPTF